MAANGPHLNVENVVLTTSSASMSTPSKRGSRKITPRKTSSKHIGRPVSPTDLLNPPVSPGPDDEDHQDDELALWAKKKTLQSDALRRHFTQMYDPRQLQEVNDELEMSWNCSICLVTANDPCVTRCGHMYCRSHITEWLENNRSCKECGASCTPKLDIVPVFAREDLSPLESPSSTPSSTGPLTRSTSPALSPEYPHVSKDYFAVKQRGRSYVRSPSPPGAYAEGRSANFGLSLLAHYFGIALRVIGLALVLGVLLPKTLFSRSSSGAGVSHASDL